jgi:hypothetical protein
MGTNAGDTIIAPGTFPAFFSAASSANQDLTTTEVDVTGATITFTTTVANAKFLAIGSFYFAMIAASNTIASGKLAVDGVVQPALANFSGLNTTPDRNTPAQSWTGTLAAAGAHTLKLRAVGGAAVAAHRLNATSTTLTILVFQ